MKKLEEMDEHSLANISIGDRNNTGAAMKLNTKFRWNAPNGRSAEENNGKPKQTAQQIADKYKDVLELPEMEKPEL